jgi:hypothetical protein
MSAQPIDIARRQRPLPPPPGAKRFADFLPPLDDDPHRRHYAATLFPRDLTEFGLVALAKGIDAVARSSRLNAGTARAVGMMLAGYAELVRNHPLGDRLDARTLLSWVNWQAEQVGWCRKHGCLRGNCPPE